MRKLILLIAAAFIIFNELLFAQEKNDGRDLDNINVDKLDMDSFFMTFPPEKNGVQIMPPQLNFSVDEGTDIELSGVRFNDETLRVEMNPAKLFGTQSKLPFGDETVVLFLSAPRALSHSDQIEILTEDGKTFFTKSLSRKDYTNGDQLARHMKIVKSTSVLFDVNDLQESFLDPKRKSGFRFCWNTKNSNFFSRYCTPYYRYSHKENGLKVQFQSGVTRAFLNQQEVNPDGVVAAEIGKATSFLATSRRGYSIEFNSQPVPLFLSDFYGDESLGLIYIFGHTNIPVEPETKVLYATDPESLSTSLGWNATIGDFRDRWGTVISKNNPRVLMLGAGGALFEYPLKISELPLLNNRVLINRHSPATYSRHLLLRGRLPKGVEVEAIPPGRLRNQSKSEEFVWEFPETNNASQTEGSLAIKTQGQSFVSNYSLYHGYSGEFSLRLAGVLSADLQMNMLGEAAYNQWFENILGWENNWFSQQRWGISVKHFAPLKTFKPKGGTDSPLTFRLTTVDLKYRFTPGLWERDETWGILVGADDVTINDIKGTFSGAGLFWARSMPKVFDSLCNFIPFFRYPKWVDMELMYYYRSLNDKEIKLGKTPNYTVNFHGKILWTKSFFGEAGFGVKTYDYQALFGEVRLKSFYGTIGLGVDF